MKKIISVVTLIAMLMGVFAVCALADPKADFVAKAEEVCPDGYEDEYIPAVNNILSQIQVTEEQAQICIDVMEHSSPIVNSGKGTRRANYTDEEWNTCVTDLQTGCKALGIWYRIYEGKKATTVEFYVTTALDTQGNPIAAGTVLGQITAVDETGPVGSTTAFIVAAAVLVVLASAAFVAQKTRA